MNLKIPTILLVLLLCLLFLLMLVDSFRIVFPPETGLYSSQISACQNTALRSIGCLFGVGLGIVVLFWEHEGKEKTSLLKLLGWFILMLRLWLVLSGIIFIIIGKSLPSVPTISAPGEFVENTERLTGLLHLVAGYCFLGLFFIIQSCVWLLNKIKKKRALK